MTTHSLRSSLLLISCAWFAAGCDPGSIQPTPQPAQASEETFENFGDY
jgi:hypothetical protein